MRTAPPFQLRGHRDRAWSATWSVVAVVAIAGLVAWCMGWWPADSTGARWIRGAAAAIGALLCLAAVYVAAGPAHWRLRWDGLQWWLATSDDGDSPDREVAGDLVVAADLEGALLLRFSSSLDASGRRWRWTRVWLPLRRAVYTPQWHAIRCAVYSPRPSADAARDSATTEPVQTHP